MKLLPTTFPLLSALACLSTFLAACESTGDGQTTVSGAYYGVGFSDPWYYGDSEYIVVRPPPYGDSDRPRPEHPIATPPSGSIGGPRATPMMPSTPRPSFRR